MVDLARWLGDGLDEEERIARDRLCVNCGHRVESGTTYYTHAGTWEGRRCEGALTGAEPVQNPARVLREIDAKRRVVEEYKAAAAEYAADGLAYDHESEVGRARTATLERMLRLLALPYVDREGYRAEWAPTD